MYTFPSELWNDLVDDFDLRDDYSGRGMFGARCIALTGQVGDLLRFIAACQHTADESGLPGDDLVEALARTVRSDDLGSGQVHYFPGVTLAEHTDAARP